MRVAGCCLIIHVRVAGNHLTDALITSNDKGISFEDSPLQENNYRTSRLNFKPELQSPFPSELWKSFIIKSIELLINTPSFLGLFAVTLLNTRN